MAVADVPPYHELLWPTLQAVTELGGSASIGEIVETVIKRLSFSDAQQAVLHNDGPETEIGYRLAWARSYLKGMGLLTNSARGIWSLTDEGTALVTDPAATDSQRRERIRELWQAHLVEARKARKTRPSQDAGDPDTAELSEDRGWSGVTGMATAATGLARSVSRNAVRDSRRARGHVSVRRPRCCGRMPPR